MDNPPTGQRPESLAGLRRTQTPPTPERKPTSKLVVAILVVGALFIIGQIAKESDSDKAYGGDDDAARACREFRELVGDYEGGILTDSEFRGGLRSVLDAAESSDAPDLQLHAHAMLRNFTSEFDARQFGVVGVAFAEECKRLA